MNIRIQSGLPYVNITIQYQNQQIELQNVLLDTGSAHCIFATDSLSPLGLQYEPNDIVYQIRGVGGSEFVVAKKVHALIMGELQVTDFEIEVGAMDYGFAIDGIVGLDFLVQVGAVIDLAQMEIYSIL